jgi:hypothetical protein
MVDLRSLDIDAPEKMRGIDSERTADHKEVESRLGLSSCLSNCKVCVGVRIRPLESKTNGVTRVVLARGKTVSIGAKKFTYDMVFDSNVSQESMYERVGGQLLMAFLDGYNATIMAYGQTGSGKTYAMGSHSHHSNLFTSYRNNRNFHEEEEQLMNRKNVSGCDEEAQGLIPRFIADIFTTLELQKSSSNTYSSTKKQSFHLTATFTEVYGEDIYDLLNPSSGGKKSLPLREDSSGVVTVVGLTHIPIFTVDDALSVLRRGSLQRTTAATSMNESSSRSHAIFTLELHANTSDGLDTTPKVGDSAAALISSTLDVTASSSRFTFVDLAGSERLKKTGAEGERAREGIKINEGLLALGNVIHALSEDRPSKAHPKTTHIPYRQSKLTRLLQDALGGNSQTLFLACVSPADIHVNETLSTLYYANRARNIKNVPTINIDQRKLELLCLQNWTKILQFELIKHRYGISSAVVDKEQLSHAMYESHSRIMDDIMQRQDVQEYLQSLYQRAIPEHPHQEYLSVDHSNFSFFKPPTEKAREIEIDHVPFEKLDRKVPEETKDTYIDVLQVHQNLTLDTCCSSKTQNETLLEKVQSLEAENLYLAEQLNRALNDSSNNELSIQKNLICWTNSIMLLILDSLSKKAKNKFWRIAYYFFKSR